MANATLGPDEAALLRRAFALAEESRANGDLPFGAVLAVGGEVVATALNRVVSDRDFTAHAELTLARSLDGADRARLLGAGTVYASGEPCPMCMGALFWTGARTVVYGLSTARLRTMQPPFGDGTASLGFALTAREIGDSANPRVALSGPFLEDEAARAHEGYWRP